MPGSGSDAMTGGADVYLFWLEGAVGSTHAAADAVRTVTTECTRVQCMR